MGIFGFELIGLYFRSK